MNRSRMLGATLAAATVFAGAGITTSAMASDANGSLTGAGSTLVAPLMARWSSDFEAKNNISVTYGPVGSGTGIAQITSRTVDFGASDAPLTPEQAAACKGCAQIPWALSATGIAFHLDGVTKLKLNGDVLAGIYQGSVTSWSDRRIKAINPGVNLPDVKITPVFRSDGSGDSYVFTDYLSRISASWKSKVGVSTAPSFPLGVGGKGNDGVSAAVASTNGSIAYIAASYIIAHRISAAAIANAAGHYEYPNLGNITAAAKSVTRVPANNELHLVNPSKRFKTAYPLSTPTYVILPNDAAKKAIAAKFISYALDDGQKFGPALDFAPLPKVVLSADLKSVQGL
jgi:phosphate transport system substrate-binding protein